MSSEISKADRVPEQPSAPVSKEERRTPVPGPGLYYSFKHAGRGVVRTISTQSNMKIHCVSAVMVMILGMALPLDIASQVALLFSVALVFFAEILNTALESFVDLHIKTFSRQAMIAKDAAAAGVLVLAAVTVAILAAVLHHEWSNVLARIDTLLWSAALGLPLVSMVVLLLWRARGALMRCLLSALSFAFAVPLLLTSTSPVFSAGLVGLLILSAVSRPTDGKDIAAKWETGVG